MDEIQQEYESKNAEKQKYLDDLRTVVINSNELLEGNCFYYHTTIQIYPELYTKQLNLFWCGKQAVTRICEIGFNAGHSCMLFLLGRDKTPLDFTIFDIGHHRYTRPAVEYIQQQFPHVNFEYVEGDSTVIMPEWIDRHPELVGKYDVVHVDGGHSEHCIANDMKNTDLIVKPGGIVIVDDTYNSVINGYVDLYLSSGNYVELGVLQTYGYSHRIIQKKEISCRKLEISNISEN
jgi:hypothetical protein